MVIEERLNLAEALLAEVEDIEDDLRGEFDGDETVRQIRDERLTKLCQRDA